MWMFFPSSDSRGKDNDYGVDRSSSHAENGLRTCEYLGERFMAFFFLTWI